MRVVFMGSAPIAVPTLEFLSERHDVVGVVTQPDKPQGRKRELTPTAVKQAALRLGKPVLEPRKLKAPDFLDALRGTAPEVIVVFAYGRRVPSEVLYMPPHGCINIHGSILPKYRGACPIERGIMAGDAETGITTFYMAEGFDTGDIILTEAMPIGPDDTGGTLRGKLSRLGAEVIGKTLDAVARGDAPRIGQDHAQATHAPVITRDEARVDWTRSAREIDCQVRACDPEPGAWTTFRGQPLKVRRVVPVEGEASLVGQEVRPGTIVEVVRDGPLVGTGEGRVIRLADVQPAGKKWMSGAQFAAGYRPTVGEKLE